MSYKVEKINPYNNHQPKKDQVSHMFDEIATNYDRLNRTLSLGIDRYWRRDALKELKKYRPRHILDIATGTGDLAILACRILHPENITAIDISDGMMEVGKKKVKAEGLGDIISFDNQDCSALSFPDNSFDAAMAAFGVRNFENIDVSFQEVLRVLKPGGVFLFIELTSPEKTPVKELFTTYTRYVMPFLSGLFNTEQRAYRYLPESIAVFPQGRGMMLIMKKNGFTNIRLRRYTLGIATLYVAEKPVD